MEEARRRIKREGKKEKREGEKDGRRKRRARFRLALLHNFIALSPVFATEKKDKKGRRGTVEQVLYYSLGRISRVRM